MARRSSAKSRRGTSERDPHELYEASVQDPERAIRFFEKRYAETHRSKPLVLREDFCGTGLLSSMWVASLRARRAVGVDHDRRVVGYGKKHHQQPLGERGARMRYRIADVRRCMERADVISALNFSYCIFKSRVDLLRYFRHLRRCLNPGGLLFLDLYGGEGAYRTGVDTMRFPGFTYEWDQAQYDPVTHEVVNHIHFKPHGGRKILRAFTYHWRLWTLPELRDILEEAGYASPRVFFDMDNGFRENANVEEYEAWVAFIVVRPRT